MTIEEGKSAPAFSLAASTGDKIALKDLKGRYVVLYFYPKDDTPGCTLEAQDFQKNLKKFEKLDTTILGVSRDSIDSHCGFADKYKLNFALLSDPDAKVIRQYGAWGEKNMYGKISEGILRSTVVIGPDGKVLKHFPKVKVDGHVDKVLELIQEAQG